MKNISEISESLWGKTLMRDIDDTVRKEDEIITKEDFYEELKKRYVTSSKTPDYIRLNAGSFSSRIMIPIFRFQELIIYFENDKIFNISIPQTDNDELNKKYLDFAGELKDENTTVVKNSVGGIWLQRESGYPYTEAFEIIDKIIDIAKDYGSHTTKIS